MPYFKFSYVPGKVLLVYCRHQYGHGADYRDGPVNYANIDPGAADWYGVDVYGWLKPKTNETYTFKLYHDDGAGLCLYDHVRDTFHWNQDVGTTAFDVGTNALDPNQWYMFYISNEEHDGGQSIRLTWRTATIAEEDVPAANLRAPHGSLFWFLINNGGPN